MKYASVAEALNSSDITFLRRYDNSSKDTGNASTPVSNDNNDIVEYLFLEHDTDYMKTLVHDTDSAVQSC